MEHVRCAHCRNPIRGRQAFVKHASANMSFHIDCWAGLHAKVQEDYRRRASEDGVSALLAPYDRTRVAAWLPEAAVDAEVDALGRALDDGLPVMGADQGADAPEGL
jgi:hypothetical protein